MKKMNVIIGLFIFALVIFGSCERLGLGSRAIVKDYLAEGAYAFSFASHTHNNNNYRYIGIAKNNKINVYEFNRITNEYQLTELETDIPQGTRQIVGNYWYIGFYDGIFVEFIDLLTEERAMTLLHVDGIDRKSNKLISMGGNLTYLNEDYKFRYLFTYNTRKNAWDRFENTANSYRNKSFEEQYIGFDIKEVYGNSSSSNNSSIMFLDFDNTIHFYSFVDPSNGHDRWHDDSYDPNYNFQVPEGFKNIFFVYDVRTKIIGIVLENHIEFYEYNQSSQQWVKSNIKDLQY